MRMYVKVRKIKPVTFWDSDESIEMWNQIHMIFHVALKVEFNKYQSYSMSALQVKSKMADKQN